jgi:hypothetical protein
VRFGLFFVHSFGFSRIVDYGLSEGVMFSSLESNSVRKFLERVVVGGMRQALAHIPL